MKKGLCLTLILVSAFGMFAPLALAYPTADSFGVSDYIGDQGTYVLVPVNIANAQDGPVIGLIFDIIYDNGVINVSEVQKGALTLNWPTLLFCNHERGTSVSIAYDPVDEHAIQNGSSGSVVLLSFSVIGEPGETSRMDFVDIELCDKEGNVGTVTVPKNGTFLITEDQSPVALFTCSPQEPKAGEEIILDASCSYGHESEIKLYEWDLDGDGSYNNKFTTSPKIYYYWDKSGTYSVKLRVTDNDGATDTFVKEINVHQNSWWEKIKKFFAPSIETLSKSEKRRFEIIKSELHISNYPHSDNPLSDLDYYSDNQLLTVLKKKIEPQASDLTYETLIIDTLHDMKLADSVANRHWTVNPEVEKYFENMAGINVWADAGGLINKELLKGAIKAGGGSGIGVGTILMLPDLCQAGIGVKLLDETLYRQALWYYFFNREGGDSPETAFGSSPIPKYNNEATREYFESLWTEYGGSHISGRGGLKYDFQEQVINQLRKLLLSGIEMYKFEPYQIYRIKSPGEVHVYDSQGRVTGLVNGEVKEEIPNSASDDESKTVLIFDSTDSYYCEVVGTDEGTYGLEVTSVEDGEATTFTATDIPTSAGAIHQYATDWNVLSQGEAGVTVQVDSDGDGTFEYTFTADNELTQEEFLSGSDGEPIPEFTTIAIPVAIVLGLIFIISRRKRKR